MLWEGETQRVVTSKHKVHLNPFVLSIRLWIRIITGTSCKDTSGLILLLIGLQSEIYARRQVILFLFSSVPPEIYRDVKPTLIKPLPGMVPAKIYPPYYLLTNLLLLIYFCFNFCNFWSGSVVQDSLEWQDFLSVAIKLLKFIYHRINYAGFKNFAALLN